METARHGVVDAIGCMLAGVGSEVATVVRGVASENGSAPRCAVLGTRLSLAPPDAAAANAAAGHALDYDDISWSLYGHPSVAVVPAALAAAQMFGRTGRHFLEACVVGMEVAAVLGRYANPRHYQGGWHATSTIGIFGAVAAAARLAGVSAAAARSALGICASMSAGLQQNFGSMTKPFHAAHANRSAILALQLAMAGMTSDAHALEGPLGWFRVLARSEPPPCDALARELGSRWQVIDPGIVLKRYPSCGATHCALDAVETLRTSERFAWTDIERVECIAHPLALQVLKHPRPASGLEGKFSMHFCVAVALVDGPPGLRHFSQRWIEDPRVGELLPRVTLQADPSLDDGSRSDALPARVRLLLRDGRVLEHAVRIPQGDPRNPLGTAERRAKFDECASGVLASEAIGTAWQRLESLATLPDLRELIALLTCSPAEAIRPIQEEL
jgi:2-methylcitrate dehydratase PrpD